MDRKRNQLVRPQEQRALSPFTTVRRMMEDMDRVFGGYDDFGGLGLAGFDELANVNETMWEPQVELFQRGDKLVVRADLPGLESKDVNVEVADNAITIKGERKTEHEETSKEGYFHSERSYGSFERRIPLPPGIDRNAIDAFFQNGVLEVTIKLAKADAHKVPIRAGQQGQSQQQPTSTTQESRTPAQSGQTNPQTPVQSNPQPQPVRENGTARH